MLFSVWLGHLIGFTQSENLEIKNKNYCSPRQTVCIFLPSQIAKLNSLRFYKVQFSYASKHQPIYVSEVSSYRTVHAESIMLSE